MAHASGGCAWAICNPASGGWAGAGHTVYRGLAVPIMAQLFLVGKQSQKIAYLCC